MKKLLFGAIVSLVLVGAAIACKNLADSREALQRPEGPCDVYERGGAPWCITYTFMPDELESVLAGYGVKNIRLSGPGAYGRTIPREILVKIMNDPAQKRDFLDFCFRYDSNPYVCGMGKDNLMAVGEI